MLEKVGRPTFSFKNKDYVFPTEPKGELYEYRIWIERIYKLYSWYKPY